MKENKTPIAILLAGLFIGLMVYVSVEQDKVALSQPGTVTTSTTFDPNTSKSELALLYAQQLSGLPSHYAYCLPEKKSFCSLEGCKEVKPTVFNLLGITERQGGYFARCDKNPCDLYEAKSNTSGVFQEFITKEPHGMLFKLSTQDNSYTEIVTLGTDSYVTAGHCYFTNR